MILRRAKWSVLFTAGLLMMVFRMEISRFCSDIDALLAAGMILAVLGGMGMLLELYYNKEKEKKHE